MADVTIDAAASSNQYSRALRSGIFWTSSTVGYVIYLDVNNDLVYRKTANGGAAWGAAQVVVAAAACNALSYDCWADWQTSGDAGTKIHIAYISADLNQIRYVYLDTSTDTVAGNDLIETCQGTGVFHGVTGVYYVLISITKTRGGNFAVAFKYVDGDLTQFESFYTSPDADTWTARANPYAGEHIPDYCLLFPGNEADTQDVWAAFWDTTNREISLKTFDNSGNSWSEQLISALMNQTGSYLQMDGAIRFSDGHLIFSAWNRYDSTIADLMVWDINGAGSIVAKTNVLTDSAETFLVSVFINQSNDDIYIAYAKGTKVQDAVKVFYQLSQNGGTGWDGQAAMQADAEDDERWISAGAVKKEWGGKFQPVWFNDDDDDIFTNADNGISIAAEAAGTIVTPATIALILTEYAPILREVITPTTLSLAITLYAPVLKEVVTPSTIVLTTTGYAPILREVLTPATLSLILTEYEPSILADVTLTPTTLGLILTAYAPDLLYCEWLYHPYRVPSSRLGIKRLAIARLDAKRLTPSRASLSYRARTCTYL